MENRLKLALGVSPLAQPTSSPPAPLPSATCPVAVSPPPWPWPLLPPSLLHWRRTGIRATPPAPWTRPRPFPLPLPSSLFGVFERKTAAAIVGRASSTVLAPSSHDHQALRRGRTRRLEQGIARRSTTSPPGGLFPFRHRRRRRPIAPPPDLLRAHCLLLRDPGELAVRPQLLPAPPVRRGVFRHWSRSSSPPASNVPLPPCVSAVAPYSVRRGSLVSFVWSLSRAKWSPQLSAWSPRRRNPWPPPLRWTPPSLPTASRRASTGNGRASASASRRSSRRPQRCPTASARPPASPLLTAGRPSCGLVPLASGPPGD